ncbi:MAG: hypothetical protein HON90_15335 [Halobacteriovoraceae bacterium]|jgi:hypothetical protein|nr:hypothetical protein [Halobacteriovoraceae bacterium]
MTLKIGIDFDNTLVDYSCIWEEKLTTFLPNLAAKGIHAKQKLKQEMSHSAWIETQGDIYGNSISKMHLKQNRIELIQQLQKKGHQVEIVSHRSSVSYCGRYQLQKKAQEFLETNNLSSLQATFLETFPDKINYINKNSFDIFIDDLNSVLIQSKVLFPIHITQEKTHLPLFENLDDAIHFILSFLQGEIASVSRSSYITPKYFIKYFKDDERLKREIFFLRSMGKEYQVRNNILIQPRIKTTPLSDIMTPSLSLKIAKKIQKIGKVPCEYLAKDSMLFTPPREALKKRVSTNTSKYKMTLNNLINHTKELRYTVVSSLFINPDFYKGNVSYDQDMIQIHDFESSGRDDPFRVLINFIHHPLNEVSLDEIKNLIDAFKKIFPQYYSFENLKAIYNYTSILWLDIMSKNGKNIDSYLKGINPDSEIKSWMSETYEFF